MQEAIDLVRGQRHFKRQLYKLVKESAELPIIVFCVCAKFRFQPLDHNLKVKRQHKDAMLEIEDVLEHFQGLNRKLRIDAIEIVNKDNKAVIGTMLETVVNERCNLGLKLQHL